MATLKEKYAAFMAGVKAKGAPTTFYKCPHCDAQIETIKPTRKEVTKKKGYWDSAKTCPECEKDAFVIVYPSGETNVTSLDY